MLKKHKNLCTVCQEIFSTESKLLEHSQDAHKFRCNECDSVEETKEKLEKHVQENHTAEVVEDDAFECEYCDFEGTDEDTMVEHIIEKHTKKDQNNQIPCDTCSYVCNNRNMLLEHFRKEHKKKTKATDTNVDSNNEAKDIHEEHRQLKNNFERLNNMFQDSLEEVKRVKSEYEAKLIEANEKVRQTVAENEVLKEKVDVLFKLGRSYINRHDLKEAAKQKEPK